ncbi:MAG TPA: hypothetical protein VH109_11085 [Steroidobacteraceae bacterium]|jgi:hypothetical protein|nr:hypothetical protein [Steroidobacteraceae bacterium]
MADLHTEKARVLHAALALPSFTIAQLAEFSGVNPATVQTTVARSADLIERIDRVASGARGGQAIVYQLRPGVRARLADQVLELGRSLRGELAPAEPAAPRAANTALDALASSLSLMARAGEAAEADRWRESAMSQRELARRLIGLVPAGDARDSLGARLTQLQKVLANQEAAESATADSAGEPALPAASPEPWQEMLAGWRPYARRGMRRFMPKTRAAARRALVLGGQTPLTQRLLSGLYHSRCDTLHVELTDALRALKAAGGRRTLRHALEGAPQVSAVIVTLDSRSSTSRSQVTELLHDARDLLGLYEPLHPAVLIIDTAIAGSLVQDGLTRPVSYVPNIRTAAQLEQVIRGLVHGTTPRGLQHLLRTGIGVATGAHAKGGNP